MFINFDNIRMFQKEESNDELNEIQGMNSKLFIINQLFIFGVSNATNFPIYLVNNTNAAILNNPPYSYGLHSQ